MPMGLFKGERTFVLTPEGDSATRFTMKEEYTGPLLPLIWRRCRIWARPSSSSRAGSSPGLRTHTKRSTAATVSISDTRRLLVGETSCNLSREGFERETAFLARLEAKTRYPSLGSQTKQVRTTGGQDAGKAKC